MSGDPKFWKDKYNKGQWVGGVRRVKKVMEALKSKGIDVEPYSDDALSTEYIDTTKHEKGEPDLKIKVGDNEEGILLEVTGPDINIPKEAGLWFRPDKFEFAENHPDKEVWGAHVIEGQDLTRFVKFEKGTKDKYNIVNPPIRGTIETFKEIPANDSDLISFEDFCNYVKNKK